MLNNFYFESNLNLSLDQNVIHGHLLHYIKHESVNNVTFLLCFPFPPILRNDIHPFKE